MPERWPGLRRHHPPVGFRASRAEVVAHAETPPPFRRQRPPARRRLPRSRGRAHHPSCGSCGGADGHPRAVPLPRGCPLSPPASAITKNAVWRSWLRSRSLPRPPATRAFQRGDGRQRPSQSSAHRLRRGRARTAGLPTCGGWHAAVRQGARQHSKDREDGARAAQSVAFTVLT